jgi:DNA-binding transcriptional ArsR family regulator
MKNTGRAARAGRRSRPATASGRNKILTEEALELIAARFRVLAEPMRLKILHTLGCNEITVSELVEATGAGQANVSKHLAVLADARLVARRKEGLNVYYRVADQTVFDLCDAVCSSLGEKLSAQHDAVRHFAGA